MPEKDGAMLAASHGIGFCEVSCAENTPSLYKAFERLLIESRARPVKPRKFSVSKMIGKLTHLFIWRRTIINWCCVSCTSIGTLIGNNNGTTRQPLVNSGTVVPCHKGELHKSRVMKRRQAFTATASLWPTTSSTSVGYDSI